MAEIVLSNGLVATVDDEDHARIAAHAWLASGRHDVVYARRWSSRRADGGRRMIYMHREVLGVSDMGVEVDHVNGDPLDNRRVNLRLCTHSENVRNRQRRRSGFSSQFKGVHWDGSWRAMIKVNRKRIYLGRFADERAAARAYNAAATRLHGAFACLNEISAPA